MWEPPFNFIVWYSSGQKNFKCTGLFWSFISKSFQIKNLLLLTKALYIFMYLNWNWVFQIFSGGNIEKLALYFLRPEKEVYA